MKNRIIALLLAILIISPKVEAQNKQPNNNGSAAGAVAAVAGAAILTGIFAHYAIKEYKELLESSATEYYLQMGNEGMFNVTLLLDEGTSMKDLSKTSVTAFEVTERSYNPSRKTEEITSRKIMTIFRTSNAWVNEYGIDWDQVDVKLWDKKEWGSLYLSYLSLSTPLIASNSEKIPVFSEIDSSEFHSPHRSYYINGEHDFYSDTIRRDFRIGNKDFINEDENFYKIQDGEGEDSWTEVSKKFYIDGDTDYRKNPISPPNSIPVKYRYEKRKYKYYRISRTIKYYLRRYKSIYDPSVSFPQPYNLDGDTYVVKDFDEDYKIGVNENKMIIYLKKSEELVELRNKLINKIAVYVHGKD